MREGILIRVSEYGKDKLEVWPPETESPHSHARFSAFTGRRSLVSVSSQDTFKGRAWSLEPAPSCGIIPY